MHFDGINHLQQLVLKDEARVISHLGLHFPGDTSTVNESDLPDCIEYLQRYFQGYGSRADGPSRAAWRVSLYLKPSIAANVRKFRNLKEIEAGDGWVVRVAAGSDDNAAAFLFPDSHLVFVDYARRLIRVYGTQHGLSA